MWIATQDGYFSAVNNIKDKSGETVLVRARASKDLYNLREAGVEFGRIICIERADYPYRAVIHRDAWANYLATAVAAIDYPNFKDRIHDLDPSRANVYMKVWSALTHIEDADWDRDLLPIVAADEDRRAEEREASIRRHPVGIGRRGRR